MKNIEELVDVKLHVMTSIERVRLNKRLAGLAQWAQNKGAPCIIEHETFSLIVYKGGYGRKFERPTFNQIHEYITGQPFITLVYAEAA